MSTSENLRKAKAAKNDEFYTIIDDIVKEILQHEDYVKQFEGKIVYCNCDDPEWSAFWEFFRKFFHKLKLKKVISTHYNVDGSPSYMLEWSGEKINGNTVNMIKKPLKGNGDFRSPECIELLKEADILVTNPPFSLYRQYTNILYKYNKQYIIWGNNNAIAYKEIFPLLRDGKMFIGYMANKTCYFQIPDSYEKWDEKYTEKKGDGHKYAKGPAITVYTNLDLDKSHEPLILTKNYKGNEEKYPKYYNYDAIDVSKVSMIPKDYYGKMGVPITFMSEWCIEQFEVIGIGLDVPKTLTHVAYKDKGIICYEKDGKAVWSTKYTVSERKIGNSLRIERNGEPDNAPYNRIIIRRKKQI